MGRKKTVRDRHVLYEAAVQSVEADLDFFERVYKRKRGKPPRRLREDFCGTAALACEWVKRRRENRAWGIDLDLPTLEWGKKNHVALLGDAAQRVELLRADVLNGGGPKVDVAAALNFSYCVFKEREVLLRYFRRVRSSLRPGGIFFIDIFGGLETMDALVEKQRIAASRRPDGSRVPAFTYVWEHARFNPVNHHILCHIHFELPDGTKIRRAFTYDWRLWTLPELQELMSEAGFNSTEVYVDGWDDDEDESDGVYRRRVQFENQSSWVAYVVGLT